MTHSTGPLKGTPKYRAIVGRLMLTIDESSVAIKTPIATIARTAHLFVLCEPAAPGCWLSLMAGARISSLLSCVLSEITPLLVWILFCFMLVLFFSPEAVLKFYNTLLYFFLPDWRMLSTIYPR